MVELPMLLRGTGWDSGSAQLLLLVAVQNPGVDVLCSAPPDRLIEMRDEMLDAIGKAKLVVEVVDRQNVVVINLANRSRVLCRTPRRDGKGIMGVNPSAVWVDGLDRNGEVEAIETVKRTPKVSLVGGTYCGFCGARVGEFGHDDSCPNPL